MTKHLWVTGDRMADRLRQVAAEVGESAVVARCHRRLRGPYTGIDTALGTVLPDAAERWPDLVEQHRVELLYGMPELTELIGAAPRTLANDAPFKQRTRYFGASMIRCMTQGIVNFLIGYAGRVRQTGAPLPVLVFEEVDNAEVTTQECLAILLRRLDPAVMRIVVSGGGAPLPDEFADALARYTTRMAVPIDTPAAAADAPALAEREHAALAEEYVASDGTSDDPATRAAYLAAPAELRARLHDRRAEELEPGAGWGLRVGAIAYHREHGSDRAAGAAALLAAQRYCVQVGFSAIVVDLGFRGRALLDPERDEQDYSEFSNHTAAALVPIGRLDESMALYQELRGRYQNPKLHMMSSYAIAMLYTRFITPRDHDEALRWQNNAATIANILPDPTDRLVFGVFQDNATALIEMHRGNLERALRLVDDGIARLDAKLAEDEWVLHRSQLRYNRARLLAALNRWDEAYQDFSILVEMDPYYTDYLSERAKISRQRGDFDAALADYDRAVELAPPFPELYYNRGTARLATDDVDGALADFGFVLDMEPDDVDTRISRAELMLSLGDVAAAAADVEAGLALRPHEPRLLCLRGTTDLERGMVDEAMDALRRALAVDPRYPAALVNLAVAHFRVDEYVAAVECLTSALEIVGPDPDVLLNRGIGYAAAGRRELAVADFDQALSLPGADVAELRFHRGRCLIESGEAVQGRADLAECVRLGVYTDEIEQLLATV